MDLHDQATTDRASLRASFLDQQIDLLDPFDFLLVILPEQPFAAVELARDEQGVLRATLAPRPPDLPLSAEQEAALKALDFEQSAPSWSRALDTDGGAVGRLIDQVLRTVFGAADEVTVDLRHGSRRAEHDAQVKLQALRGRLGPLLTDLLGHEPRVDADGDFVFDWGSTQVFVAPRAMPGAPLVVRVFAITNVGVAVSPELALFVARINFSLVFGRFALDLEHAAIWFSESLLGDFVTDDEFRYTVRMVAETANDWDDRIAQMFGGFTHTTAPNPNGDTRTPKPGEGGYL